MNTPLPPILETKLADFRRRVWVVKLAEGVLAAFFGLALSYLLVFALDRFFETPAAVRLGLLLAGAATLGLGLPLQWHRWVWRQRRLEDAARLLRRTFPRLGDQLLGIVELARMDHAAAGRSERLVAAAMARAVEAVKDRDFSQAVPEARHRQWGWAAAGALGLAAVAFVGVNEAARNALARWALPWRPVERYTFARVQPLPSRLVVPYAEPFQLPVRLAAETRWSPAESRARIGKQPAVTAPLADGGYALSFPPQKDEATMGLSLGDVRQSMAVVPETRPELEGMAVRVRLPEYLGYRTEPRIEVHGGAVSVLKGADAAIEARASRELAGAQLDGHDEKVSGATIATDYQPVSADADRKLTWRDRDGLTPRDPMILKVRAVPDEPPTIVARRESLDQVVLDSEVVNFEVAAGDDFGIKRVGLEWTGTPNAVEATAAKGETVAASGGNEMRELPVRATFCATREGVPPQALEVRAWAEDYLPGRARSHSASFTLYVLNKTDHALWLTEQFGKWLEGAKETYEREQALHQSNQELRALPAAELDRPENRRRVAQQAAAENGNAERLGSLTDSGRHLVEQATKNDEFDAKRLESWATMLKSLQDIAGKRMPSVSDLLKATAGAPAGKPGQPSSPSSPSAPTPPAASPASPQENATAAKPADSATAPSLVQGAPLPSSATPPPPTDPNAAPKPAVPSLADREAGSGKPPEPAPANADAAPKPPSAGKLGLPGTTLAAAPQKPGDDAKPPESPAQEKMQSAITEQKDLLAEFAKVSDQLGEILASLEASTFVKRFKAASRQQISLAGNIGQKTLDAFGIEHKPSPAAQPIAVTAKAQSEVVRIIQSDLDAYAQRKQDSRFKGILEEMKKMEIVRALDRGSDKVTQNLSGQSMSGSEYWADILDRWSEELVAASNCKCSSSGSSDSLPPEIVLKVMQALREEMALRDETRETENAKAALEAKKYAERADQLSTQQANNTLQVKGALQDILGLPEGEEKFAKEAKLLQAVTQVMEESEDILSVPETGGKAVAAETEAIELLLQSKRMSPKGGGGGGSSPGGGGAGTATMAALSELGPGGDTKATVAARPVGQATGRAGKEFPEEFKPGLESYFNLLEGQSAPR